MPTKQCLACQRGADAVPLIDLDYQGSSYAICPQHLPILVHDPTALTGLLPGAENLTPSDHKD
jgi:hypothetical protein